MNPVGILLLTLSLCLVLFSSKKWATFGFAFSTLYITQGQQINLGGLNLYAARFVELAAFCRVVARKEFSSANLVALDKLFILVHAFSCILFLTHGEEGSAKEIGVLVDALLCYFSFRGLVSNMAELKWFLGAFAVCLVPYTALVWVERLTLQNPFASMGGVVLSDWMREGKLRCQGSFRHPSLLGTLGACFLPLYIGCYFSKEKKLTTFAGIFACLMIVAASNSGGPVSGAITGMLGWLFWRIRTRMSIVRRALSAFIIVMAFTMEAPIWYLLARLSSMTGGDGWHRSYLMDIAFQNFDKWWLTGMPYAWTADWFPYRLASTDAADITNAYILFGIHSGIFSIALFIIFLTCAFSNLGKSLAAERQISEPPEHREYMLWGLGVTLVVHATNLLGITYFDQTYVLWFMHLAFITTLTTGETQFSSAGEPQAHPHAEFVT
jgi:hypothetical protein